MALARASRVETNPVIVKTMEGVWNSYDSKAHTQTPESFGWRNSDKFSAGREAIKAFLIGQWGNRHYALTKERWAYKGDCISVQYEYQWWHGPAGRWYQTYGNERWKFVDDGAGPRRDISAMTFRCLLQRTTTTPLTKV